jgi:hypothetical protein
VFCGAAQSVIASRVLQIFGSPISCFRPVISSSVPVFGPVIFQVFPFFSCVYSGGSVFFLLFTGTAATLALRQGCTARPMGGNCVCNFGETNPTGEKRAHRIRWV